MRLAIAAPAKINRELRVGRLRPDGYHEVFSRMVSIDLADRLVAEPSEGLEFFCTDPSIPSGRENLVVRAAERLAERAGVRPRARLTLEKRVPAGGGLGGGSADAAATLRLLSRFWGIDAEGRGWLPELAAALGSDVPFFLVGGEADVTGRGEIVTPVEDGPSADLLLLTPPFPVSTAAVYRAYAGRGTLPQRLEIADASRPYYLGPNDLAPAVLEVEPRLGAYLASAGRITNDVAISGSGATIVLRAGPEARDELARRHPDCRVFACRTLSRATCRKLTDPKSSPGAGAPAE